MKKLFAIILACFILMSIFPFNLSAESEITVYIDGEKLEFEYPPEIVNGYTMVPMRKLFEAFGAYVTYKDCSSYTPPSVRVGFLYGYTQNSFNIGDTNLYGDYNLYSQTPRNDQKLSVAPYIKNSTTYIPLRDISTLLHADVSWDPAARRVDITTPYPRNKDMSGDRFDIKSYEDTFKDDVLGEGSISVKIIDNVAHISIKNFRICTVKVGFAAGTKLVNHTNFDIMPYVKPSRGTGSYTYDEEARTKIGNAWNELSPPTSLEFKVPISGINEAFGRSPASYTGRVYDFSVNVKILTGINSARTISCKRPMQYSEEQGYYVARETPTILYEFNKKVLGKWINPSAYTKTEFDPELKALSDEICKEATDDYDKIKKIYTWIAQNIAYNHDSPYQYTGIRVVKERNAVCTGYASLFTELACCQGLPCHEVFSVLKSRTSNWTEADTKSAYPNHVSNRVYVDNRWINIDVTCGSYSYIRNGSAYYSEKVNYDFFDFSDWDMSFTHCILA